MKWLGSNLDADSHSKAEKARKGNLRGVDPAAVEGGKRERTLADRAFDLMDYLVNWRGWQPAAAAVAAGNAEQESSIRSDGPMGDPSVPGGSWGLFQWNRARLERLKAKYGDNWQTDAAQYKYFADESEGKIPGGTAVPGWAQQRDLSRAGAISHAYEGYGDASTETRVNNARKWLSAYRERLGRAATPMSDMAKSGVNASGRAAASAR